VLAAVYLVVEAGRRGDRPMRAYFTRRAQAAAIVAGALSLAALFELRNSNPAMFDRLTARALPLVVLAGVCGLAVLALLTAGQTKGIRAIGALGVAAVIWGWGVAQYPVLLPGTAVTLTRPAPRRPRSWPWSSSPSPRSSWSSLPAACCSACRAATCSARASRDHRRPARSAPPECRQRRILGHHRRTTVLVPLPGASRSAWSRST
jgi:hypothetical protein